MATKSIKIQIATSGAQQAAQQVAQVGRAIGDVGSQSRRAANDIDQVADATRQLGTSGGGKNAGFAVLEMSRAFEDSAYGIRGVLNNIPGLVLSLGGGAGLAGVISIAAVAASTLWTKLNGGTSSAKKETGDLLETYKQLLEVYSELDERSAEDREKAAKAAAEGLKRALGGVDTDMKVSTDAAGLQGAREAAALSLQLTQDRVRLAELEKALTLATGTDALKLAKEREAVIRRIYDTELGIAETGRQQALSQAEAGTAAAGRKLGIATADAQGKQQTLAAAQAEQDKLNDELARRTTERVRLLNETVAKIKAQNEELKQLALETGNYELTADIIRREPGEIRRAQEKLGKPSWEEEDLAARRDAMDPQIAELTQKSQAAADAQQQAADAMQEATRALLTLREQQDVDRTKEGQIKATEEIGKVGQDVTKAAVDAIEAIKASAAANTPAGQEAISGIQSLIADTTPDAQQGGQLAGLLQRLANNLTAKDQVLSNGINQMIRTVTNLTSKYQGLTDRIKDLETRVNQIK